MADLQLSLADAQSLQHNPLAFLESLTRTAGDLVRIQLPFRQIFFFNHPDLVQHILLDHWRFYSRNTFQYRHLSRVTGAGLLTLDGPRWQDHRRLAQPAFHARKIEAIGDCMNRAVGRLARRWSDDLERSRTQVIDLDAVLMALSLEVVGEALFSTNFSQEASHLSQDLLELMEYVIYRSQNVFAPPTWMPTTRNRGFRRRLSALNGRLAHLIRVRRPLEMQPDDLLGLLIESRFDDGTSLTDREIRDEIVTMIIAGYETVASSMGWIFQLLAVNPDVLTRLRAALPVVASGTPPSISQVQACAFLQEVIAEGLRLYPPSWLLSRRTEESDRVAGMDIPRGSLVIVSPYTLHRHPDFWPDPARFLPARFSAESIRSRHRFAYIPFGAGPHLCIGRSFALLEIGLTLAGLLPRFDFSLEGSPPEVEPRVTIRPRPGLSMRLRLRG